MECRIRMPHHDRRKAGTPLINSRGAILLSVPPFLRCTKHHCLCFCLCVFEKSLLLLRA